MGWIAIIENALAITGIINCLLVAFFLFFTEKGIQKANRLLSFLLVALSLKMSYTLLANYPHEWGAFSFILFCLCQGAYVALGPLLYLYFQAFLRNKVNTYLPYLIFIPSLLPFLQYYIQFNNLALWIIQVWFLLWLVVIFRQLRIYYLNEQKKEQVRTEKFWMNTLYGSFCFFWLIVNLLFLDFLFELSVIFTITFYVVSYMVAKHYWLKKGDKFEVQKYKNSNLTIEKENEIFSKLKEAMEIEKLYIDPEITLPKVAAKIHTRPHYLSLVINKRMQMTFNEYINSYRINDIKNAMKLTEYQDTKIASIAFDYGFNAISTFNTAFKKFTNYTPSEYRNVYFVSNRND